MENTKKVPEFWSKEDWQACWLGFTIILIACIAVLAKAFDFSAVKFATWSVGEAGASNVVPLSEQFGNFAFWRKLLVTFGVLGFLFTVAVKLQRESVKKYIPAFIGLFHRVAGPVHQRGIHPQPLPGMGFWALLVGLLISNTVGVPQWLKPAIKTEFYIKTGLVIMGFSVLFSNIARFGLYGLGITWIVTPIVILFMWWLGTKVLKIDNKPLVITLSTATSVCRNQRRHRDCGCLQGQKPTLRLWYRFRSSSRC